MLSTFPTVYKLRTAVAYCQINLQFRKQIVNEAEKTEHLALFQY